MRSILLFALVCMVFWVAVLSDAYAINAYDALVSEEGDSPPTPRLIFFYQNKLSIHDGARCRFYPTCSDFYAEAISRYGWFWGTLMIIDRLFYRENRWAMKYYPYESGKDRRYDPVYNNFILNRADYYR